ncbi:hypothetical protein FB451DRAFT_364899 [Mycena latifolia]|nr:hypothetical protein FB451DRAFT_364899 [Mycena latifolia]
MAPPVSYVHLLPVELWQICLTLCSIRQLRRISLVCHLLRALCIPFLLEHQSFDVAALAAGMNRTNWMDRVRHLHRTAIRVEKLSVGPYPLLVRSWKVTLRPANIPTTRLAPNILKIHLFDAMYERATTTFRATLGVYQNLTALEISGFTIDAAFLGTLASLSHLEALTIRNSEIVACKGFLGLGSLTACGLRLALGGEGPLQIASPETLHTLNLDADNESSPLIAGFGPAKLAHLTHLSFGNIRSVHTLFGFLKQCPLLESLSITWLPRQSSLPAVHPSTIPLLRTLTGPGALLQLLAPNRPVSCATVLNDSTGLEPDQLMRVCMDISRSASPLRSLSLPRTPPTLKFLDAITSLFPDLRELSVRIAGRIQFRCGGSFGRRSDLKTETPVDSWSLELRDEDAFDTPPVDELSDAEEEPPTIIFTKPATAADIAASFGSPALDIIVPSNIHAILRWILDHQLLLPANIEVLRLGAHGSLRALSLVEQRQAVSGLSVLYPLLREVQFGEPSSNWKLSGELWTSEEKRCMRVVL